MTDMINLLVVLLLAVGTFFTIAGTVGFIRFPDFYSRMHATGKCDTLGEGLMLLGLILYEGATFVSVKMLFLIVYIFVANPTATHAIAKAAYDGGIVPWTKKEGAESVSGSEVKMKEGGEIK